MSGGYCVIQSKEGPVVCYPPIIKKVIKPAFCNLAFVSASVVTVRPPPLSPQRAPWHPAVTFKMTSGFVPDPEDFDGEQPQPITGAAVLSLEHHVSRLWCSAEGSGELTIEVSHLQSA